MKQERHATIRAIIADRVVETQEELLRYLKEAGYHNVTQATVSRDMRELRLVKAPDESGHYRYCVPKADATETYGAIFKQAATRVDYAGNNVVIKCHSGTAGAACAALDHWQLEGVVGTLAGDATILIITRTPEWAAELSQRFLKMLHGR